MSKSFLIFLIALVFIKLSSAQERCATEKFEAIRRQNNPKLETKDQFERWMSTGLKKKVGTNLRTDESQATYVIPVVVHIIHNGASSAMNISDAQVLSQIKVLNNDFQRLNADAPQTPAIFQSVAGEMSVEFVLAKQDPLGNPTSGIVRVNGGKPVWYLYQDTEMKSKSYWPTEQYFNIWVTNFEGYIGYAQFPVSNLVGLDGSPNDRLTDGVIIDYRAFGSIDDGPFDLEAQFNKGRTLTHEAGHFFGLHHIWGDGSSCSATDYVNDTPPQIGSTSNCPTHPKVECSSQPKMFQNYLDYTDDKCMNIFTKNQVSRMEVVLQNSPRRKSLLSSSGAFPPGNYALDLGILSVQTPTTLDCSGIKTPTITIRNFGSTTLTQTSIELKINGIVHQTKVESLSLLPLQQKQIAFNNYTTTANESKAFQFTILSVNGSVDENPGNNTVSINSKTTTQLPTPFLETFESPLTKWDIINPDGLISWQQITLPNTGGSVIFIPNYEYEIEGALDKIVSPVFNLTSTDGLLLKFKLAHAQYPGTVGDALSVYAFNGCSEALTNGEPVFFKEGEFLATTDATGDYFFPKPEDWKNVVVPLNQFLGSPTFRFAFVSRNGNGNNIFIDSVQLIGSSITNLAIQKVIEPSLAVCESSVTPKLEIANQGTTAINGFSISVKKNGVNLPVQTRTENLIPGSTIEISLNQITLSSGLNDFSIQITPNGPADSSPQDNVVSLPINYITTGKKIPVLENFSQSEWSVVNSVGGWVTTTTDYKPFGRSAVFKSFTNSNLGMKSWLVSPKLDFSETNEASLFVDFSYARRFPSDEFVEIVASTDCGKTFSVPLYANQASDLLDTESDVAWVPAQKEDWTRKYFNLNSLAGNQDVLLAIKATNFNGNNLYVDNIEFFENDDSNPVQIEEFFRIYNIEGEARITFKLSENQPVHVQVATIMGSIVSDFTLENILNQTLTFQLQALPGIYIFKVQIGNSLYVVKQFMGY